ncbi:MAG TPA: NIPSNAP family protein [Edaphobacter sp.]|nr:NIPSNAP family protein [Edaphobacter sp.]
MITGAAAMSALLSSSASAASSTRSFFEIATWRLHNSDEDQAKRVAEYLESGLFPALTRGGAKPVAAFSNLIGPDGPSLFSIAEYTSLGSMQEVLGHLAGDAEYNKASQALAAGPGMPFVTMESSLFQSLAVLPQVVLPTDASSRPARIFELRTYQSQSMAAREKKAAMFNNGEIGVFQRLGMRPVFIGESLIGGRQPNITYMLSFDNLDGRETHWKAFGSDPEWKKISGPADLKDAKIVANISNIILHPLPFSPMR